MNVLFVSVAMDELIMPTPPLGLVCCATAARRAGHRVLLVELKDGRNAKGILEQAMRELQPGVICIAVRNIDDQTMCPTRFLLDEMKWVIAACRELTEAALVLGGAGYSMYPERVLAYLGADLGVRWEGEKTLPAVLASIERGEDPKAIPNVYLPGRPPRQSMIHTAEPGSMAAVDEHLWPYPALERSDVWLPFQTRRGCPLNCSYCSTASIEGTRLWMRDPASVTAEIVRHVDEGFSKFYCVDNTFNIPRTYAGELCRKLAALKCDITWSCILYPDVSAGELAHEMARAGCSEVSLGFESGSDRMLRGMNKRFTAADVRRTAEALSRSGIRQMGFLLLGGPGETRGTVEQSLAFADSLPLDRLKITVGIRIYTQTHLFRIAVSQGVISATDDLFAPRFYLAAGLNGWLQDAVQDWLAERPHWQI